MGQKITVSPPRAGGDFQMTNDKHIGDVLREWLSVLSVSGEDGG